MNLLIDLTSEPEVVVADAMAALMPSLAAIAGARGPAVSLAILLVVQDWLARAFLGDVKEDAVAEWLDDHTDAAMDLADPAAVVMKLRTVGAAGTA